MSTQIADDIIERTNSALSLASDYMEHYTGQWQEKVIERFVEAVRRDMNDDYEELFYASLPALEACLWRFSDDMADHARKEMYGYDVLERDEY